MADRPEAANGLLKSLQHVFRHALEYDYADDNSVEKVERLKSKNKDGYHTWTLEKVEKYENRHPIGTAPRLAMALLLYTGQRRSDVVVMERQHVKDGWIKVHQMKTKKRIEIPIFDVLQDIIDATKTGDMTYLISSYCNPFKS